jgi:hypothetical protein
MGAMRTTARWCAVSVAGAAAVVAIAGSAVAANPVEGARLALSVHHGESAEGAELAAATLTCLPIGGSHPHAADACRALNRVGGRVERIPARTGVCPMIYNPVTAVASGHWGLRPVHFTHVYPNSCVLGNALRPVFDF